jgi:hypothetical protein
MKKFCFTSFYFQNLIQNHNKNNFIVIEINIGFIILYKKYNKISQKENSMRFLIKNKKILKIEI